jgi:hypothetical protein
MASTYPIVRLKREPKKGARIKGRKPYFPKKIPHQQQIKRLGSIFDDAAASVLEVERGIEVSTDPRAVVPERALVFELIGPVAKFEFAAQALGLEWLISESKAGDREEDESDQDDRDDGIPPGAWLYLTMPSLKGLKKLLAEWKRYKDNQPPSPGASALWKLFDYLKDLRVWSAKDRVDPSIAQYVRAMLEQHPDKNVLVEIDFWYRSEAQLRDGAMDKLREMLAVVGGELLDPVHIPEIRYQGALVRVPPAVACMLANGGGRLASLDEVMTIRPQSAYVPSVTPSEAPELPQLEDAQSSDKERIAVLLDGYPVASHEALAGRLTVHEVEVSALQVPVAARFHGTAMASLILHGDLHASAGPLDHHLIVVPVLTGSHAKGESTPADKLPIGVIHRALRHIVESDDPDLANIAIVNHSLCDTYSPFVRRPSPWAALLDYYSHQHRLLFVVSAGNIPQSFPSNDFADFNAFQAATPATREAALLLAVESAKGSRSLLSPAESINALTIGALHADGGPAPSAAIDPYINVQMTNLASAVGLGVNRSLKPDMVEYGGRFGAGCANIPGGGVEIHARPSAELGQLVASPSPNAGVAGVALEGAAQAPAAVFACLNQLRQSAADG